MSKKKKEKKYHLEAAAAAAALDETEIPITSLFRALNFHSFARSRKTRHKSFVGEQKRRRGGEKGNTRRRRPPSLLYLLVAIQFFGIISQSRARVVV